MKLISDHAVKAGEDMQHIFDYIRSYRAGIPESEVVADLGFGNPFEPPLSGLVGALRTHIEPKFTDWFAYKLSEAEATEAIAAGPEP